MAEPLVQRYHHLRWADGCDGGTAVSGGEPRAPGFRLGITRDVLTPGGAVGWGDIGLALLDGQEQISWEFLAVDEPVLSPGQVGEYDALLVMGSRLDASSLLGSSRLKLVARLGVGFDSVDLDACSAAGIAVTITPDGVRRPLAAAAMTLVLALSHNLLIKDGLVRTGRWNDRMLHMGRGLTGATLGLIGVGNVGREIVPLAQAFGMSVIAYDPYVPAAGAAPSRVALVDIESLLRRADFVCVCCPLNAETRHLVGERELSLMKPNAFLVNVARGPIVDQAALTRALQARAIRGAGLDVFELEPPETSDPLLQLDNVILAPHALCWTDEQALGIGSSAINNVIAVSRHSRPAHVVNPAALQHPRLVAWFGEAAGPDGYPIGHDEEVV
jgi:D-3-phosphoglycerate dehydrogenase